MVTDSTRGRRGGDGDRSADRTDRGQVILIGAVALAFIVLGVVVVFNGVLFTETLSSADTGQSASGAEATELEVRQGVACLVADHNDDSLFGGDDEAEAALRSEIETYAELHRNATAHSRPAVVNVTPDDESGTPFDGLFTDDASATVTITYDSGDLSYERTIDVATNECPRGPTVERFDVTVDDTVDPHLYTVDWAASGSDLSEGTITFSDENRTEERSIDVSGTQDDGTEYFFSDSDYEVQYIEIVVEDDAEQTDEERWTPE